MRSLPPRSGSICTTFADLLLLGVLASPLLAQPEQKDKQEEKDKAPARADSLAGEVAPVGRWYTAGGSASRCGVSAAQPIFTHELGVAWEYPVDGEIEEEPLVWDELVVLVTVPRRKQGEPVKERTLHVVRLSDGKAALPPRRVTSELPIGASMWGRVIAYRDGKNSIRVDQVGDTQFVQRMRFQTKGEVSPPLLFGNQVYYTQDGRIERIDLAAQKPAWSIEGNFRGRASLLGDHVFALRFARITEPTLALVDRYTGALVVQEGSGLHGQAVDAATDVRIAVSRSAVVAHYDKGMAASGTTTGEMVINTAGFRRRSSAGSERLSRDGGEPAFTLPCVIGEMQLLPMLTEEFAAWAITWPTRRGTMIRHVADSKHYADLLERRVPATVLGPIVLVGDFAFDAETLEIVWQDDLKPTQRTIPARQTLLVSRSGKLVALRDARAQAVAESGAGAQEAKKGVAVLQDGRVLRGELRLDRGAKTLTIGGGANKKGESLPLDRVLWVEEGDKVLHWGDAMGVTRAIMLLLEEQMRVGYVSLASKAIQTNDQSTISRYLVEALELGADEKSLAAATRQVETLRRAPQRVNGSVLKEVDLAEAKLRAELAEVPWRRAKTLPASAPEWLRWLLPDLALAFDEKHAAVGAWVREQLPAGMPVPDPFVPDQWLVFAEACAHRPMRVVADGAPEDAWELEQLAKAKASWRPDLMAVCSDRLCVLAPKEVAGAVGRCLATGELVVDALEAMFSGIGKQRVGDKRLLIKLYATRDEFLDKAAQELLAFEKARKQREQAEAEGEGEGEGGAKEKGKKEARDARDEAEELLREKRGLSNVLGFFVPDEGVTRLYMPEGKEGYLGVVSTFSHELTHHWLEMRGPRFDAPAQPRPRIARPGYWVVEGFASFVESFVWDVAGKRYDTTGGLSEKLDTFAHAGDSDRLSWSTGLTLSQVNCHRRLPKDGTMFIRRARYLGVSAVSKFFMLYAQGAATCDYLFHADDGKHRKALLEYVVNYYSGCVEQLAPDTAFGGSADELGQRVTEFAERAKK